MDKKIMISDQEAMMRESEEVGGGLSLSELEMSSIAALVDESNANSSASLSKQQNPRKNI